VDQNWVKKFRVLTFALIFSGALNIGLLAAVISFTVQDTPILESFGLSHSISEKKVSNIGCLASMSKLSFKELVALLTNRELVEEGYSKRDLALSSLTAYHNFNIEKAIGPIAQKRVMEDESVELYPGLSEQQFAAIIKFAYQEKWPLTSKGLFALLHTLPTPRDASLDQAFSMTPEFFALQVLFQKTGAPQSAATLTQLASEGSFELLDQFTKEQTQLLDLSVEKRRRLLLSYLAHKSSAAAELLIKTDATFALKRLDDKGMMDLLSLLNKKTVDSETFCASLLHSPRNDAIRRAAGDRVRAWGSSPAPVAVQQAVEAPTPAISEVVTQFHTVGEGESLWKISRQYQVKVDDIVQLNGIDKDKLFPGMTLKIPQ
jgi:LysM repeat protein